MAHLRGWGEAGAINQMASRGIPLQDQACSSQKLVRTSPDNNTGITQTQQSFLPTPLCINNRFYEDLGGQRRFKSQDITDNLK